MADMDSMEKSFEHSVERLSSKDMKEGDRLRIKTRNSQYEFIYTLGTLVAFGDGHVLAHAIGNFKGAKVGEKLVFGLHATSSLQEIMHIRLDDKNAQVRPPEAMLVMQTHLKLAMADKEGVSFTAEEASVLRDMFGIAQMSSKQEV